jgi:regulator of replication initiation timing
MADYEEKQQYPQCDWEWRGANNHLNDTKRAQWFCRRVNCESCDQRKKDRLSSPVVEVEMKGKEAKETKFKCDSCAKLYAEGRHMQKYTRKVAQDNKQLLLANSRLVRILGEQWDYFTHIEEEEDELEVTDSK